MSVDKSFSHVSGRRCCNLSVQTTRIWTKF